MLAMTRHLPVPCQLSSRAMQPSSCPGETEVVTGVTGGVSTIMQQASRGAPTLHSHHTTTIHPAVRCVARGDLLASAGAWWLKPRWGACVLG